MKHMELFITKIDSSLHIPRSRSITFSLTPTNGLHLELKTGEIFQSKNSAEHNQQEHKQISASFVVHENLVDLDADKVKEENTLYYFESFLSFSYGLKAREFEILYSSIISGHFPKLVYVSFAGDGIETFRNNDGEFSERTWDNEKQRSVPIASIGFNFEHVIDDQDDESDDFKTYRFLGHMPVSLPNNRSSYSDLAKVSYVVIQKLSSLQKQILIITWIVFFLGLVIWRLK